VKLEENPEGGAIVEVSDRYEFSYLRSAKDFVTRKWYKFPVETRKDWEEMKKRYDSEQAPGGLRGVVELGFHGPFWQLREWLGFEGLCMMMDALEFVSEMVDFWTEFVYRTLEPILERVELDCVTISEDMTCKNHSMISPDMVRKFLFPAYRRWVRRSRRAGAP